LKLTEENKAFIDGLPYESLLEQWRFAIAPNPWFQGETGEYWKKRIGEIREKREKLKNDRITKDEWFAGLFGGEVYEGMICPECEEGWLEEKKDEMGKYLYCDNCKMSWT